MTRRVRAYFCLVPLLAGLLAPTAGPALAAQGPGTWTWPSSSCNATLQSCIDGAVGGDTVVIETNAAVLESLNISKSLTLNLGPGYHASLQGIYVDNETSSSGIVVDLHDLVVDGSIRGRLWSGPFNSLAIANVVVTDPIALGGAIDFDVRTTATIVMRGNSLRAMGSQTDGIQFNEGATPGAVSLDVVGNRISGRGNTDAGAGISVYAFGSGGSFVANLDNNAVLSAATCHCGGSGGIDITPAGTAAQTYNLVGNTVDRTADWGLHVDNQISASGSARVNLFNNIVTHSATMALAIGEAGATRVVFLAGHNDMSGNAEPNVLAGHSAGAGNLSVAPGYVDAGHGNVALKSNAPAIDAGLVCSPGGVAMPDAAGHARLHGASVDLGAYERGAGAPTGVALVGGPSHDSLIGTAGDDILCGMGGADLLMGKGGNDYLDGGAGRDVVEGGKGSDRMFGGSGDDILCAKDGTRGNDRLDGGAGTDQYQADRGDIRTRVEQTFNCTQ